jgi:hypothetical protein
MTRRRLTNGHRSAVVALDKSATGSLHDGQLRTAIGHHASNVIRSLQMRDLISWEGSMFSDIDAENAHLGASPEDGKWVLTSRGNALARELGPKPAPCCPTCGQFLPSTLAGHFG